MNGFALAFFFLTAVALLFLSRRWAPLPLLMGACYMTLGQGIEVGPFHFTVLRLLVIIGFARIIFKGERLIGRLNSIDWLMLVWAGWALISSAFHEDPNAAFVYRLGIVYDACGIYFLIRIFCLSFNDVVNLYRLTAFLLIPIAFAMIYEHLAFHNLFSIFGGVPEIPQIREGKIRAFGPFAHPILAGTVGAVCLPIMVGLWRNSKKISLTGIIVCFSIIIASSSSGPIMSAALAIGALLLWPYRQKMRAIRWFVGFTYLGLYLVMKVPPYYLLGRIDIAGGSTGYHRARLIESALDHINEWWLGGTDYTRHWMPTGVSWNPNHTDITNHYLQMGVLGGLPLMLLFIAVLVKGFSFVGKSLSKYPNRSVESQFMIWALGAGLFAHTATSISVSYFDQSFLFLYLNLISISSIWSETITRSDHKLSRMRHY